MGATTVTGFLFENYHHMVADDAITDAAAAAANFSDAMYMIRRGGENGGAFGMIHLGCQCARTGVAAYPLRDVSRARDAACETNAVVYAGYARALSYVQNFHFEIQECSGLTQSTRRLHRRMR
jgi:hypothetical protein